MALGNVNTAHGRRLHLNPSKNIDMTEGSIIQHIIRFAFPLLLGNLFQQLYTTVDTWVLGNYVSNEAYSAVGAIAPVINMLVGFFLGFSAGTGVVISQYYGAQQYDRVHSTVHTAIAVTFILSIALSLLGMLLIPFLLRLMNLHASAVPHAKTYLTIYFSGMLGLTFYNIGAAILRAIGDSRRPFYFLVACAVLNTLLDLLLVLWFKMGVNGVALATIISQFISAILVVIVLMRTDTCVKLQFKKLHINFHILKQILKIGTPAAFQTALTSFANIFGLSYINYFDIGRASPDVMSGWTSYLKVDQLITLPMQSIALAASTFVGQNLGKNQVARAKKGVNTAVLLSISMTIIIMIPILIFAPDIIRFLNDKEEAVQFGAMFLRNVSPFLIAGCFNMIYSNALRGAGLSFFPMVTILTSFVGFRQLYLFCMSRICNELIPIAMSYPAGWVLSCIIMTIYYFTVKLDKNVIVDQKQAN